jgi:hypothetical protein
MVVDKEEEVDSLGATIAAGNIDRFRLVTCAVWNCGHLHLQ